MRNKHDRDHTIATARCEICLRPICRECNQKRSHQWHGLRQARLEADLLKKIKVLLHGAAEEL